MSSGDQMCPCAVCGKLGHWESSHAGDYENLQRVRAELHTVLDCVDYYTGNCKLNDMVSAVLPIVVIINARKTL
jgi:hypothetical protein